MVICGIINLAADMGDTGPCGVVDYWVGLSAHTKGNRSFKELLEMDRT